MNERIGFVDYGKSIAIFLVILGHLNISSQLYLFIYSFHIPFFFFISGYLFNNTLSFQNTVKKYLFKLIIPYFWFSLISFLALPLFKIVIEIYHNKDIGLNLLFKSLFDIIKGIFYGSMTSLGSVGNVILWFLPCLFTVIVLFKALNKINLKVLIPIFIILQFIVPFINSNINPYLPYNRLPLCLDSAFIGVLFFAIGFYVKNCIITNKSIYINLLVSLIIFLLVYFLSFFFNTSFDIANIYQGKNAILTYFISFFGIYGLVLFSDFLAKQFKNISYIQSISKNTLYVFAFQFIIIWSLHRVELILPKVICVLKYNIFFYSVIILCLTLAMKVIVKKMFSYFYIKTHLDLFLYI